MIRFNSFFMGGFECADQINRSGERINLLLETDHSRRAEEDYRLLAEMGITTVREGICWSFVEVKPYHYDFSEVISRIMAAEACGVQQIWDICHFGYPDGLIPTHPAFCDRFASVCRAFVQCFRKHTGKPPMIIPINEISFLAWHSGDMRGTVPFAVHSGFDIKYHLCRAAIKGIEAIKAEDSEAHIIFVEPLIKIHSTETCDQNHIQRLNEDQFQAIDIIAGHICPELGGKPGYIEILGFNYYYNNQWVNGGETLCWQSNPRSEKLSFMLEFAFKRYKCPILLSETGHFGSDRAAWIRMATEECAKAIQAGVDLRGMCIYPVIDRPDWDNLDYYCQSGIWDLDQDKNRTGDPYLLQTIMDCHGDIRRLLHQREMMQRHVSASS